MIVTVVTPTLNAAGYLRECIESVQANAAPDIEIEHVIVDGGSTDGTVELAKAFGLPLLTGKDRGIFDAINKGSLNSRGELLGFLGADDVMLPGGIEAVVATYRASGCRWVVGGIRWIDERGRGMGGLAAPPSWMTPRMTACLGWNPLMHMGTYFSREFFTELGGFNIDYRDSGDYEMFARARTVARYGRIARPVACFRRTGVNNSAVNGERTRRENQAVADQFGPPSAVERRIWRFAMKVWFNVVNPTWLAAKLCQPVRIGMGLQERPYF
jgi:glycosyltransferase involved in cell wall biosynthesis